MLTQAMATIYQISVVPSIFFCSYELFPLDFPNIILTSFFIVFGFFFFCKYLRLPQDFLSSTVDSQTVFINIGTPLASFARTQYVVPSISLSSFRDLGNPPEAMLQEAGALNSDIEDIIRKSSDREYVLESTRSRSERGGIRFLCVSYKKKWKVVSKSNAIKIGMPCLLVPEHHLHY